MIFVKLVKYPSIHPYGRIWTDHMCGVNIFKTLRLWDRWTEVNETWHVYSTGHRTKPYQAEFWNMAPVPQGGGVQARRPTPTGVLVICTDILKLASCDSGLDWIKWIIISTITVFSYVWSLPRNCATISRRTVSTCSDTRLCSASRSDYNVLRTHRHFTSSSFSISAPTVWNCLPSHICSLPTFSSFLTRLKTHLFNTSFSLLQHVT